MHLPEIITSRMVTVLSSTSIFLTFQDRPRLGPKKKKMLYCVLGAKTWVGRSEILFFFFPFFSFSSLFGLILLSFECFYTFFCSEGKQKNFFFKADRRFQDFGVGRKGQYNIFLNALSTSLSVTRPK